MSKASDAALARAEQNARPCPRGGAANGCRTCREMCASGYPGRFTPTEALRAIEAGHAGQMLLMQEGDVDALRPAIVGWEGLTIYSGAAVRGQCAFLGASGSCQLHETGYKPLECRVAACASGTKLSAARAYNAYHDALRAIRSAWRTREGARVRRLWREALKAEASA